MALEGRLGMVGGGNMGSALLRGLLKKGVVPAGRLVLAEASPERREDLARDLDVTMVAGPGEMGPVDILVVAVKPPDVPGVLKAVAGDLKDGTVVISLAAGVTLATLAANLPAGQPVVRAMPNTPALVSLGATAITTQKDDPEKAERSLITAREVFAAVGQVVVVAEKQMDAVTGLSGSGPAYVFVFMEALSDAGVLMGLDRSTANLLASHTVAGAAALYLNSGMHTAQLKDMVTSPGGTTIHGLEALELSAFRAAVMQAVRAATERSEDLGRK